MRILCGKYLLKNLITFNPALRRFVDESAVLRKRGIDFVICFSGSGALAGILDKAYVKYIYEGGTGRDFPNAAQRNNVTPIRMRRNGTMSHQSERGEAADELSRFRSRNRSVGSAAATAIDAYMTHEHFKRAPVVGERFNDEIDKPVGLGLPLRRGGKVVLCAEFADFGEMLWNHVVVKPYPAGENISHRKRGNQKLIATGEPYRLLVEHAAKLLAGVEIPPGILYAFDVLEIEKPDIGAHPAREPASN